MYCTFTLDVAKAGSGDGSSRKNRDIEIVGRREVIISGN
jgi:hypothetical protein